MFVISCLLREGSTHGAATGMCSYCGSSSAKCATPLVHTFVRSCWAEANELVHFSVHRKAVGSLRVCTCGKRKLGTSGKQRAGPLQHSSCSRSLRVNVPILGPQKYLAFRAFCAQVCNNEVHGPLGGMKQKGAVQEGTASACPL